MRWAEEGCVVRSVQVTVHGFKSYKNSTGLDELSSGINVVGTVSNQLEMCGRVLAVMRAALRCLRGLLPSAPLLSWTAAHGEPLHLDTIASYICVCT